MTTLSFNLSSDRRLLLSLPQQTVMQYQLSDDLPSAPPFRLFPTIERDGGGRSECIRAVLTVQVHRGGFCHGPTPVKHMNCVCVCVVVCSPCLRMAQTLTQGHRLIWFSHSHPSPRCSPSPSGCWCTWNFAVNFRQRGSLPVIVTSEQCLLWCVSELSALPLAPQSGGLRFNQLCFKSLCNNLCLKIKAKKKWHYSIIFSIV